MITKLSWDLTTQLIINVHWTTTRHELSSYYTSRRLVIKTHKWNPTDSV